MIIIELAFLRFWREQNDKRFIEKLPPLRGGEAWRLWQDNRHA